MHTLYYIPATIKRNVQSSAAAIFIERERKASRHSWAVRFLCYSDAVSALGPPPESQIIGASMLYRQRHVTVSYIPLLG